MPRVFRPVAIRLLLTACIILTSLNSLAQGGSDADTKEVLAYTLTDAGLAKYMKATQNLAALPGGMAGDCDDDSDADSLADSVAKINATPGAEAAIRSAGMATREYVVFSWSLLHNALAGWAASEPGGTLPPGAKQSNVDFLKKHEADLKQLEVSEGSDSCDQDDYEEEEFGEDDYEEEGAEE